MAHTPGEWKAEPWGDPRWVVATETGFICSTLINDEANATAIAALPDLLEACGSAVWLLNNRHNKDSAQWERYAQAAEEDLLAAIAKARGA